jgi:hypothetical protein
MTGETGVLGALLAAGFAASAAILGFAARRRRRFKVETAEVRCPHDRRPAGVETLRDTRTGVRIVTACSRFEPPCRVTCDGECVARQKCAGRD